MVPGRLPFVRIVTPKLWLMIRATLMMLTSSDLHVFLLCDSGPSALICRRAAVQSWLEAIQRK